MIRKWGYIIKSKKYDVGEVLQVLSDSGAIKLVTKISKFGNELKYYQPTNKIIEFKGKGKHIQKSNYKKSTYKYKYDYWYYRRAIYTSSCISEVMVNTNVLDFLLLKSYL